MKRILIITSILPIPDIEHKKDENDILFETENRFKEHFTDITFQYLYVVPDTNRLISLCSKKWRSYFILKKAFKYSIRGRSIFTMGIIQLPRKFLLRHLLYDLSFILNKKRIQKILAEFKPTLVHAQNTDSDAYLARRIQEEFDVSYVVTLRGLNSVADSVVKRNIEGAKEIIALSPTQEKAGRTLTHKGVHLIPHGIRKDFFITHAGSFLGGELKFISVCRLLKLKNIHLVIEALSHIEYPFIYHIYGDGPERIYLDNLIKDKKLEEKIKLKGIIPNKSLPNVLKTYDVFVMPSFPESLGRVYFEAMACGVPIVAAKNTGVDGIIEDRKEGFLVNPGSINALVKVFERLSLDRRNLPSMGESASQLALKYRWDNVLERLHNLYSQ